NLDNVNLASAIIYDADVTGASMENLDITNAQIFNTDIGVGGAKPTP
ncbi:MAG: pentapeptide repeat-containing protein, partial [Crocosphaera sp.]|nr:pentapeptide repeat-containing protein [Crocosphaera sp.]